MKCSCHMCDDTVLIGMCAFCSEHCPHPELWRMLERAVHGIMLWRIHLVKSALEEEGVDPVEWWPYVQELGTFEAAERWVFEQHGIGEAFRRSCTAGEHVD